MATTITSTDTIERVTLDAVAGNLTAITVPRGTRTVYLQSFDSLGETGATCYLAVTGTDGAGIGADYLTIPSGAIWVEPVGGEFVRGGATTYYVASTAGSGILEVRTSSVIAGVAP